MKLELKHLAPYLPYGLKMIDEESYEYSIIKLCIVEEEQYMCIEDECGCQEFFAFDYIKPILRPISSMDLEEVKELQSVVKDEDVYIAVSDTDVWIEENISDPFSGHMELHVDVLYAAYEWLFKKNFDVFGLINKGLAVEKIKKNEKSRTRRFQQCYMPLLRTS